MVSIDGRDSEWRQQCTSIRQGWPLSPYLFVIVMTALFKDIDAETEEEGSMDEQRTSRVPNTNFDDVLYADDTICLSTSADSVEARLRKIVTHGLRYGLRLNQGKCEVLNNSAAGIRFPNGDLVKQKEEVCYLGAKLNIRSDTGKEVQSRLAVCMATLKKLDLFWLHAQCPVKWKLLAHDSIIRSKLLYGLESAELTPDTLSKMDSFQFSSSRRGRST